MPSPSYAVIDVETTGFRPDDRVLEIGVVGLAADGSVEHRWQSLVCPGRDIDNTHVHGVTPQQVTDAPCFGGIAAELADLLQGRVLVAHNAAVATRFLVRELAELGVAVPSPVDWVVCTRRLAESQLPGAPSRLADCLAAVGSDAAVAHTALARAEATAELFTRLADDAAAELAAAHPLNLDPAPLWEQPQEPAVPRGARDWLTRVAAAAPADGAADVDRYLTLLADVLVDGRLSDGEIDELVSCAGAAGFDAADVAELHDRFMRILAVDAWSDGVLTEDEREWLIQIADELDVPRDRVSALLATPPQAEPGAGEPISLRPGDRVGFAGMLALPRGDWRARVEAAGLTVGGVVGSCRLVVAADPGSGSGKVAAARRLGIPVVDEAAFATLLRELTEDGGPRGIPAAPEVAGDPGDEATMDVDGGLFPVASEEAGAVTDPLFDLPEATSGGTAGEDGPVGVQAAEVFPWAAAEGVDPEDTIAVVDRWIEVSAVLPLHELSPHLEPGDRPEGLSARQSAVAAWYRRYPEPLAASARDLRDLRGVGRLRLQSLVYAVALRALDNAEVGAVAGSPGQLGIADDGGLEEWIGGPGGFGALDGEDDSLGILAGSIYSGEDAGEPPGGLELVAGWLDLAGLFPGPDAPAAVTEAADAVHPGEELLERAQAQLPGLVGADPRRRVLLEDRLIGGATLEAAAEPFGLSRERMRQLQSRLRADLAAPGPELIAVVDALGRRFRPCARIADVVRALPSLEAVTEVTTAATLLQVLDVLAGDRWCLDGEWLLVGDVDERLAGAIDELADRYGVVDLAELARRMDCDPAVLADRLEATGAGLVREGLVRTALRSIADRAAAELAIRGEPMTLDDITALIDDRSPGSVGNALIVSDLVHRCGHGIWALAEWGMPEWTNLVDHIRRRIRDSDGAGADLGELIEEVRPLGISESTLRTYVASPEFDLVDGRVHLGSGEAVNDAIPEEARNLYRRDGAWMLLATVTPDHLRGSGTGVPAAVGALYDVPYNGAVLVPSRFGEQRIRWGRTGVTLSTIRRHLEELGSAEGRRVWLRFAPDLFEVLPATDRVPDPDPGRDLLNHCGFDDAGGASGGLLPPDGGPADPEVVLRVLAEAVGLPGDAPRRRLVARFRHRGEEEVAERIRLL
ncbi:exonuclease domain-containing protein [Corynebacterium sphenisci]|uniref:exonuclease domain-containing protein n=1 Tax=Corynebacterium sphenisci TaxID=191493 RepID=UPI000951B910|nr:exonuclease domain-containing protein [Corynebacterium sphenisci]